MPNKMSTENNSAPYPHLISYAEQLTSEWLTAVLRANRRLHMARVVAVDAKSVGNGMLGCNLRLTLHYDVSESGAPQTLVAKLPAVDSISRNVGASGLYLKEVRFYQEAASTVKIGVPEVLFADISADMREFCLLFEDLAPAIAVDQLTGCTVEQAGQGVDAAALLHGPRWGDPALKDMPWLEQLNYRENLRACFPAFRDRYADELGSEYIQVGAQLVSHADDYYALFQPPWTITHGDFRLDNMLFEARGGATPVALLDWQTVSLGVGTTDISYMLGAGLSTELRRQHEEGLVKRYHEALLALGVSDYAWDQCWRDYRLGAALGFVQAVVASILTTRTERGDQLFLTMARRHLAQMVDLETLALLPA